VLAESQQEVIETVRLCHRFGVPFVARGSGTSLSGGSLPVAGGIVIALNRLNRVLEVDAQERVAVVEPGVINLQVSRAAAPHGLAYAPDPSSQQICTIGGNVAFNSGGAHCLKHGMTANHVLAIRAVLPDGEVVELGSRSTLAAGPDLAGAFCGSEGLFGIALELTLRLVPVAECVHTVLAAYDSLPAAGEAVASIVASGLLPVAMEIMDALAIQAAEASVKPGYPEGAGALLIVELEGERAVVAEEMSRLRELIRGSGAVHVSDTEDPGERAQIWRGRKSAFSAVGWLAPDYIVQDGVVPRSRLGEALEAIQRCSAARGIQVANVFHAGDGNLHPLILFDGRAPGALHAAEELAGEILRLCVELGGSITGEHGVAVEKRAYLPLMFNQADLDLMRRIRLAVDPLQIANRGKMLPEPAQGDSPAGNGQARAHAAPMLSLPSLGAASDRVQEIAAALRAGVRLLPRGAGTKPALCAPPPGFECLQLSGMSGILEYDPSELTVTALSGTPLAELSRVLAEHGQGLPFDPVLVRAGATIGGTVAAASAGAGSYCHGGVRDFIIGVRFLDGTGTLVSAGGRVVKNAAGFELPKLMVGSMGRLGVLVALSFKVFPSPQATATVRAVFGDLPRALAVIAELSRGPLALSALDLEPPGTVLVRLAGSAQTLPERAQRLAGLLGAGADTLTGEEEERLWRDAGELAWAGVGDSLVRVSLSPRAVPGLQQTVQRAGARARYSAGANVCWVTWPAERELAELDRELAGAGLSGMVYRGRCERPLIGDRRGAVFAARLRRALDPDGIFAEL
jgi:glycolate oxidase